MVLASMIPMQIGVIADTHGVFHPAIKIHFAGVEHIIHAGDIGKQEVVDQLEALAPVVCVTGNIDWGGPLDRHYPRVQALQLGGCQIFVKHIGGRPQDLVRHLPDPRPDVYIFGHSHIALVERIDDVLFVNPGSAGYPRFGRQPSLAVLTITMCIPTVELIWL